MSRFGEITDFWIKRNEPSGFAFVTYGSVEEATKAKEGAAGTEIGGESLRINYAKPRKPREGGDESKPRSRACFKCQQEGHMARDCPNENAENN